MTAAKRAGGDEGGLDRVLAVEAGGRGCTLGSLKVGWTEFVDRLDVGVREREEAR